MAAKYLIENKTHISRLSNIESCRMDSIKNDVEMLFTCISNEYNLKEVKLNINTETFSGSDV